MTVSRKSAARAARPPKTGKFLSRHPLLVRGLRNTAIVAVAVVGIYGLGFASGWVVSDNVVPASAISDEDEQATAIVPASEADVRMPDVRGLTLDDAKQVLADAGVDIVIVTSSTDPAAGESGVVIAQVPAFGAGDPTEIALTISVSAPVPDVIGETATNAIAALTGLGAQVQRDQVYVPGAVPGTVLAIEPVGGAELPAIVTMRVASVPTSVALASLDSSGRCSSSRFAEMESKEWPDAVVCASNEDGLSAKWSLNAAAEEVVGTIGISDSADSLANATVQFFADGKELATFQLKYGETEEFAVPTSGMKELTVTSFSDVESGVDIVIGEFEARGTDKAIEALVAR